MSINSIGLGILTLITLSALLHASFTNASIPDSECKKWCSSNCSQEATADQEKCNKAQQECAPAQCKDLGRSSFRGSGSSVGFRGSAGGASFSSSSSSFSSSSSSTTVRRRGSGTSTTTTTTTYGGGDGGGNAMMIGLIFLGIVLVIAIIGVVICCSMRKRSAGVGGFHGTSPPIVPQPYGAPSPYGGAPNPYGGAPSPYGGAPDPFAANAYPSQTYGPA